MIAEQIERVFGHGRLRMVTGEHVEVYREAAAPGERRRYTKRFLETGDADFRQWTEREWRILARLIGHGVRCVPDVVQFDGGVAGVRQVQTYDAGITVDQWGTLLPVARNGTVRGHVFEDCAHWWALAHHGLAALDEIHALQLVHLDVKADNICIPYEPATFDPEAPAARLGPSFPRLALIDFAFSLVSREKLRTALPLGWQKDFDYQSPRLLRALEAGRDGDLQPTQELDWRCDLYSLAAMLRRYLPDDEWVRGEGASAGWTSSRYGDARSLIYRLRECHDRDLTEVRPHRALMETTGAHLHASDLARSLSYGWTIAREHEAARTTALLTPMTRIAPARATPLRSPVVGPIPTVVTALPDVFRRKRVAEIEGDTEPDFRIASIETSPVSVLVPPRGADEAMTTGRPRRAARTAAAAAVLATVAAAAALAWHDGWLPSSLLSPVAHGPLQTATTPAPRLAAEAQPPASGAPAEASRAAAPSEAVTTSPARNVEDRATENARTDEAVTPPIEPGPTAVEVASAPAESSPASEAPPEGAIAAPATPIEPTPAAPVADKPEAAAALAPSAPVVPRSVPAKRGNIRTPRAGAPSPGTSKVNPRVASAPPRATAPARAQTFVAKASPSVSPVVASPRLDAAATTAAPAVSSEAATPVVTAASASSAAPTIASGNGATGNPSAPATAAAPPADARALAPAPAPAPAEAPKTRVEPLRSAPARAVSPLQLHEPWRSVVRDMLAVLGVTEQRAAPIEERSVDRSRSAQDRARSAASASPPAPIVAAPPMTAAVPQASVETARAVLPPPPRAIDERSDNASNLALRPNVRAAPTAWPDSEDILRTEGKRMIAEDVPRVAAQARSDISTVLAIAAAAQEPAQDRAVANAAFSRWSSERWSLSAASPSRARDFHVHAKRAFAAGRDDNALDLALQSFAANPRDADAAGLLALLYLRAKPAQPETARQLALHALALSGSNRIYRLEDWHTFAVASALSGRELDGWRGLLVELSLSNDVERTCRAAVNAYATYGERLRPPVQALMQRVRAQGRDYNAPSCAWTPYRTANAW